MHLQTFISIRWNRALAMGGGNELHAIFSIRCIRQKRDLLGKKKTNSDFVFGKNKKTLENVIFEHSITYHFHRYSAIKYPPLFHQDLLISVTMLSITSTPTGSLNECKRGGNVFIQLPYILQLVFPLCHTERRANTEEKLT